MTATTDRGPGGAPPSLPPGGASASPPPRGRAPKTLGFDPHDVEIVLFEAPRENWCFRGIPGDQADLGYRVGV